jgi:hypothetical protein
MDQYEANLNEANAEIEGLLGAPFALLTFPAVLADPTEEIHIQAP